jgi:hypothetical protein
VAVRMSEKPEKKLKQKSIVTTNSIICGDSTPGAIRMNCDRSHDLQGKISFIKFGVDRLRGFVSIIAFFCSCAVNNVSIKRCCELQHQHVTLSVFADISFVIKVDTSPGLSRGLGFAVNLEH